MKEKEVIKPAAPSLDDLVFNGRNKEYGAYPIRKTYLRRLIISLSVSTSLVLLFVFGYWFFSSLQETRTVVYDPMQLIDLPTNTLPEINLDEELNKVKKGEPLDAAEPTFDKAPQAVDIAESTDINELIKNNNATDSVKSAPAIGNNTANTNNGEAGFNGLDDEGTPKISLYADFMPEFPGGPKALQSFILSHLVYPEKDKKNGTKGSVQLYILIMKDGTLRDIKVVKGLTPTMDSAIINVFRASPPWIPARQKNTPINIRCIIPIKVFPYFSQAIFNKKEELPVFFA